jgi:hypothetical protein
VRPGARVPVRPAARVPVRPAAPEPSYNHHGTIKSCSSFNNSHTQKSQTEPQTETIVQRVARIMGVTHRVERDSMPPGSPYKRDSHASAVLPSCHVETCCMGFPSAKIERFCEPIEIERESEKRMDGHSPHLSDVSVYIYFRHSDTSGWRRPRIKARRLYGYPNRRLCVWRGELSRYAIVTVRFCGRPPLSCTAGVRGCKRLLWVRWFERFWEIVQKLLDVFGVGC